MPEPSQELREAAKLMRERARTAALLNPGRWGAPWVKADGSVIPPALRVSAEFVASMSPAVALPLARWLAFEARVADGDGEEYLLNESGQLALATARAYLGTGES
jgi:hypothetical protein